MDNKEITEIVEVIMLQLSKSLEDFINHKEVGENSKSYYIDSDIILYVDYLENTYLNEITKYVGVGLYHPINCEVAYKTVYIPTFDKVEKCIEEILIERRYLFDEDKEIVS